MKIGERIRKIRKANGMTILELATAVGSDVGNLSRLERGVQGYTESTISKIAEALGVKVSDLFSEEDVPTTEKPKKITTYRIDVLDVHASAGPGVINSEVIQTIKSIEYTDEHALLMFGGKLASSIKMITVEGDSMSGTIEIGDSIFVDITKDYFSTDGIYVFLFKNRLHVKRLQMMPDHLLVHSDNPQYANWKISEENEQHLKVMGRVLLSQSQAFKRHG